MSWWMLGFVCLLSALDVAGDDQVAGVVADPDGVEGGATAAAVAVDVQDQVDRTAVPVAAAADEADRVAVARVRACSRSTLIGSRP